MTLDPAGVGLGDTVRRAAVFPRLRYMGSKYRLVPYLAEVFAEVGGTTALDAFAGSGVVSYLLKSLGCQVTSNDFLCFPTVIARATVANQTVTLTGADIESICGPAADTRTFIQSTFDGLHFTADDRQFLDSAWSHIDRLAGPKRALAISALVLAAARKQPRGVFTVTDLRYDDGRPAGSPASVAGPLSGTCGGIQQGRFANGRTNRVMCGDVADISPGGYDRVYLDPPYAPPRDDNDYIKRYHFLEGLSVYWRNQKIMENTRSKKPEKRYTPFAYKHTITEALRQTFKQFRNSTIVLSYSSNAVPDVDTIESLLRESKGDVEIRLVDHKYSFGTHATAQRRAVAEYIIIGR